MNRKPFVSSVVPENPTPWDPNAVTKLHSPSSLCLSLESSLRSKPGPLDASLHQAVFQELPEAQLAGLVWVSGNGTLCNPCHMAGTVLPLVSPLLLLCRAAPLPSLLLQERRRTKHQRVGLERDLNTGPYLSSIWIYLLLILQSIKRRILGSLLG